MDYEVVQAIRRAAVKTFQYGGIFFLITGGIGMMTASIEPGHTSTDQVALVALGLFLTALAKVLPES